MRRLPLVAAALVFAGSAHAWSRRTAEHEAAPTLVKGKLEGPIATFTVKFVLPVEKEMYGQHYSGIELPPKGMVTAATASINGVTYPLQITDAEDAEKKFNALAADEEHPPVGPRASAVLISGTSGNAGVSVANARGGVLTLEVTIASPTCFFRDMRYVSVPATWLPVAEVELRRRGDATEVAHEPCAASGTTDTPRGESVWMAFPAPELARRRTDERIGTFASRVALGDEHITRVEIDLSAQVTSVPRDLATVILVDGSRSMSADDLEAQRQVVMSYLRGAPDSRVQVLAYSRRVKPLLPGWMTASQAARRLDRELRAMAQRNGSHFDVGLAEAASWLDRVTGTKRVVVITDERMAGRLESTPPVTLKRLLPAGTLVHVVALGGFTDQDPQRDEDARLAPLAAATDGMAVRAGRVKDPAQLDATLLVRPISLDFVKIKPQGWTQIHPELDVIACGDQEERRMPEGESCAWWGQGDASAGPVIVEGLLWGKRIQRFVHPDPAHGRDVARELSVLGTLDEPLLAKAHFLARAVNETWSMYAQWGGTAGYESGFGFGMSGGGGGSHGCCGPIGTIGRGVGVVGYWEQPDLAKQLRPLLAACRVEAVAVRATVEMTLTEIAELTVALDHPDGTPPATKRKRQQCVEDALWDSTPMLAHVEAQHTYEVNMPAVR